MPDTTAFRVPLCAWVASLALLDTGRRLLFLVRALVGDARHGGVPLPVRAWVASLALLDTGRRLLSFGPCPDG
jgi:hypothetical protein